MISLLIITLLSLLDCSRKSPEKSQKPFPLDKRAVREEEWELVQIKGRKIKVEVARTEEKRRLGLMYRDSLPKDCGMLFVFEREGVYPFWMKDTRIPLDIAFVNKEKVIIDIQSMEPFSLVLHSPKSPFLYALEVNRGFFKERGIGVGDTLIFLGKETTDEQR